MSLEQDRRISEVVSREQSRLRSFIRRRVPDPRDVEDILQDVFYELVEANRLLMPIEHVAGWLFQVARHRIIVAIWTLKLEPGARWLLPAARGAQTRRMLYFFAGQQLRLGGTPLGDHAALEVLARQDLWLENTGSDVAECLLLQGRPIGEPVAQYGPFVMNTQQEIMQAMQDYRRTQFGGWPWKESDPVHGSQARRFARYPGAAQDEVPA